MKDEDEKDDSDREYKAEEEEIGDQDIKSNKKEERDELHDLKKREAKSAMQQGTEGGAEVITH